ncbi:MAG: hypothetical protein MJY87_06425 [Fibrobacter sp.]|nr:hypothetical protein [Fibrobacter sp.]
MKILLLITTIFVGLTFADVNPESIYPAGCKRKGNLVKCPIKPYNAGVIYDLDKKLMYKYFPKGEKQTEMASVTKCKNIVPFPTKSWTDYHKLEDFNDIGEFMLAAINSKNFEFACDEGVIEKRFFCQDDRKRVLIIKYDDLGIEDDQIITTTDNPRYCKDKFDKKFK